MKTKAISNGILFGQNINVKSWSHHGLKVLFSVAIGGAAIAKLTQDASLVQLFQHIGYPLYLMNILGVAYLLGIVGIFQKKIPVLTEWAHAGFTFALLGAFFSHLLAGDPIGAALPPLFILGMLAGSYYLGKQVEQK